VAAKEGREDDARSLLEGVLKDEERWCAETQQVPTPDDIVPVLVSAHFLDRAWAQAAPEETPASAPWLKMATNLVAARLSLITAELTAGAAMYLLAPLAYATEVTVGEDHPVTEMVLRLARRRMSTAAAKRIAKKTQDEERLVRALEARDQDPKILADVPVLEKISALRNVALRIGEGNIWGSDIPRAQRAVKLLEQALQLHEKELQNNDHPCLIPELEALSTIASKAGLTFKSRALTYRERALRVLSIIARRYMEVGQLDSAVLLLESALVRHQMELGTSRNRTVVSNSKLFDEWIMQVPEDRRPTVTTESAEEAIGKVVEALTDQPQTGSGMSVETKADLWAKEGLEPLPVLV